METPKIELSYNLRKIKRTRVVIFFGGAHLGIFLLPRFVNSNKKWVVTKLKQENFELLAVCL